MTEPDKLRPTEIAGVLGISIPFASQILTGARTMTPGYAVRIYRATGRKLGPIENATDAEIDVLERFA